ncbi:putative GPI mannosyltransferase 1 [Blattamonas nauphoetae]|uniref:GPI mannosyltransferase 1 n=1 Tax=Blattamonas nauphoetae TaxID=2049346 RepID=A0ABQ9XPZ7_9EUKA|nr:putative GPI mannosyltransferase 1 [Blattamonas nauphoetae]
MKLRPIPVFLGAFLVRIGFLLYGVWQDATMTVKYTDIDYQVLTEGADYVMQGQSPFYRSTYRYSPLYAYLVIPNRLLGDLFGKFVFIFFDMICGFLIYRILKENLLKVEVDEHTALKYSLAWLYNPIVINVSTRGSSESIITLCVLLTVYTLLKRKLTISAIIYGLSVHVKIYPVLFTIPFMIILSESFVHEGKKSKKEFKITKREDYPGFIGQIKWLFIVNRYRIYYAGLSFTVFVALTGTFYYLYGFQCLYEMLLYHASRTDVRHNFSVFWLHLYLKESSESTSLIVSILFFLPQIITWVGLSVTLYKKLALCLFGIVFQFVMFNKVCTVQYFVWWFALLPLALPFAPHMTKSTALILFGYAWLRLSYYIEFRGESMFFAMFFSCVAFFFSNLFILLTFLLPPTKPAAPLPEKEEKTKKITPKKGTTVKRE